MRGQAAVALVALGLLAGCATPLEQCLIRADSDRLAVQRELDERRQNLQRGFSIERVSVPVMVPSLCGGPGATPSACLRMETDTQEILHPIKPTFEAERIALLERQLSRAQAQQTAAAAQCRATHTE